MKQLKSDGIITTTNNNNSNKQKDIFVKVSPHQLIETRQQIDIFADNTVVQSLAEAYKEFCVKIPQQMKEYIV